MAEGMRIAVMTGGGDCPGLNAAIRAVAKVGIQEGYEVLGIKNGWEGLLDVNYDVLDRVKTSGIIDRGGTILGTSRTSPLRVENGAQKVLDNFKKLGLTAIVVLGGEGTLSVTSKMYEMGLPAVGIPKTIDNDVEETDYSIGFQTAVEIATQALDRLRTTAESHHRVMLLEVMGRTAGWIAVYAGMANGADAILIPEIPMDEAKINALCQMLLTRRSRGVNFSIVAVAEGTTIHGDVVAQEFVTAPGEVPRPRLGGVGAEVAQIIEHRTGLETRMSSLNYIQRGGTPVAYDRILATAFGVKAVNLIKQRKFGRMTALKGSQIVGVPFSKVVDRVKTVDMAAYRVAERFFG